MKSKIKLLEEQIIYHKQLYYAGKPEISDFEYDKLEEQLKKLDPKNKILSVIGTAVLGDSKIRHDKKMLSLDKTYSRDELIKWKAT